jgi:hypothetical protein
MPSQEPSLTEFQQTAEHSIAAILSRAGRRLDSREILQGVVPFFSKDPQTVLKLRSGDFEVWLYDDEASFSAGAGGGAVERLDFSSDSEALDSLLRKIELALNK